MSTITFNFKDQPENSAHQLDKPIKVKSFNQVAISSPFEPGLPSPVGKDLHPSDQKAPEIPVTDGNLKSTAVSNLGPKDNFDPSGPT